MVNELDFVLCDREGITLRNISLPVALSFPTLTFHQMLEEDFVQH